MSTGRERQRVPLWVWLQRHRPPAAMLLVGTAVVVGLGAGFGAVVFRWLINLIRGLCFGTLPEATAGWGKTYVVLAPVLGGLIVGPLTYFFAREARGHGVPEVMEAVALRGGRIRPVVAVIKSIASSLSIGSGGSVGREGPIVQIGSTIGSSLGQWLKLSDARVRNLVACGAAGGIAATFNAPIAGVLFALEVILGDFSARAFGTVVIASVTASVVGRAAFGDIPAFVVPEYDLNSLWELPMYLGLGLAAALVATFYTRALYWTEDRFESWRTLPPWLQPAIGGLLLGVLALGYGRIPGLDYDVVPQVYGVGYETISGGLHGTHLLLTMLALMVLKIVATSITLGSGGSGGVFAPGLFIGSMLGGSFGLLMELLFPGIPGPPGAYALVGMGAVFAGSTHASMTAVIMMFEMTGDYKIILPLMLAVVGSSLFSGRLLGGESIYTMKLTRRGVRLRRGRDVDVLEGVRVGDALSQTLTVRPDTSVQELRELFLRTNRHAFPVVADEERLVGIVSLTDVRNAAAKRDTSSLEVQDLMTRELITAFPDETLDTVLRRMGPRDLSRLPVVDREHPTRLLGVIRRNDIVRAYNLALTDRDRDRPELPQHIRSGPTVELIEIDLPHTSAVVGKTVRDLAERMPSESLLISIRRPSGEVVFPHGSTRLGGGDRITAWARRGQVQELLRCFDGL